MKLFFLLLPFFAFAECEDICTPPCWHQEEAFLKGVKKESRRLYNSLDCIGKNRAIEISKQYRSKDAAIQAAAREMGVRQAEEFQGERDYQRQLDDRSGQTPYRRRYGY